MNIEINQMTTAEKIRVMEDLWDDLCHQANELSSPSWHQDVLTQRENSISTGEEKFIDWKTAKKNIREKI